MRYKCIKSFSIPNCDDNGFITEQELIVEKDTVWELTNPDRNFIGGEVRLEIAEPISGRWLEITEDTLEEHFEEVPEDLNEEEEEWRGR